MVDVFGGGSSSFRGLRGPRGPQGSQGSEGPRGPHGLRGSRGMPGTEGSINDMCIWLPNTVLKYMHETEEESCFSILNPQQRY